MKKKKITDGTYEVKLIAVVEIYDAASEDDAKDQAKRELKELLDQGAIDLELIRIGD